jgi:hypothetical protein
MLTLLLFCLDTSHASPPVIPKYSYATKFAKAAKRKNLEKAGVKIVIKPSRPKPPSRPGYVSFLQLINLLDEDHCCYPYHYHFVCLFVYFVLL